MEPHRAARAARSFGAQLARVLVLHPEAHVLEHRERVREVHRATEVEELEAEGAGVGAGGPAEVHREGSPGGAPVPATGGGGGGRRGPHPLAAAPVPALDERLGELDVAQGPVRAVPAAVAGPEHRLVAAPKRGPRLRPEPLREQPGERASPLGRRTRDPPAPGGGHGPPPPRPGCAAGIVAAAARSRQREAPPAGKPRRSADGRLSPIRRRAADSRPHRCPRRPPDGVSDRFPEGGMCLFCNTVIFSHRVLHTTQSGVNVRLRSFERRALRNAFSPGREARMRAEGTETRLFKGNTPCTRRHLPSRSRAPSPPRWPPRRWTSPSPATSTAPSCTPIWMTEARPRSPKITGRAAPGSASRAAPRRWKG